MRTSTIVRAGLVLTHFAVLAHPLRASDSKSLAGTWVGGMDIIKKWFATSVHFTAEGDALRAAMSIPDLGSSGLRLMHVRAMGAKLHFELPDDTGDFVFDGQVQADEIVGEVSRGKGKNPFHLVRIHPLDPKTLERYLGLFQFDSGETASIARGTNDMGDQTLSYVNFKTGELRALLPLSDRLFFTGTAWLTSRPRESTLAFRADNRGEITGFELRKEASPPCRARRVRFCKEVDVRYSNGEAHLAGTLMLPSSSPGPHPAVILVHGSANTTREAWRHYAHYFASHGVAVLIYDKRGVGKSKGGTSGRVSLQDLADDVRAGVSFLRRQSAINPQQVGLWGLSQGCWIVEMAAAKSSEVAFLMLVSGGGVTGYKQETRRIEMELRANGFSEKEIRAANAFMKQKFHVATTGEGWAEMKRLIEKSRKEDWFGIYAGAPSSVESLRWTWDAFWKPDPAALLADIHCPVLALFGSLDTATPVPESVRGIESALNRAGHKDFTIKIFQGANHRLEQARTGGTRELIQRVLPEQFDVMKKWLSSHLKKTN